MVVGTVFFPAADVGGGRAWQVNRRSVVMLAVWTIGLAGLAGWAYRRDEGRRFT